MDYLLSISKELEDLLDFVKDKKIGVGLSGGVDSSVTALILKDAGAKVTGYVMNNMEEDVKNARLISDQLKIKLEVVDLKKDFEKEVIRYFIEDYENGKTPNPCVVCNCKIKFGILMEEALKDNDFFTTGHYLKKVRTQNKFSVERAKDINKDQSYALSMLSQEQLSKLLFPLGYLTKNQVREIAKKKNLEIRQEKESVDLCFTDDRIRFLKTNTKNIKGLIKNSRGEILGEHKGIQYYAIGQRRRLGIDEGPYYVKKIDADKNEIIVGRFDDLYETEFRVSNVNWLLPYKKDVCVIVRNKMEPQECEIFEEENKIKVKMKKPIWAPAPGQLAVFYDNDIIVGGGWIV
ncbi:tRNA 2-thiouridine(34) synthase MnmA [Candidatus Micrarchaeota archaeon]|nr:tRNA 2-thiouridine(34) synthase MnmA [Candidatus Micrarchaeota archaeon]